MRSKVLTGKTQPLNRAQQRKRIDRKKIVCNEQKEQILNLWLQKNIVSKTISIIECMDIDDFLRKTANIHFSCEERLRKLAVFLEENIICSKDEVLRGWLSIDRVYKAAVNIAPNYSWLYHSRAITAHIFCEQLDEASQTIYQRIVKISHEAINHAIILSPHEEEFLYFKGYLCYFDPSISLQEALRYFKQALNANPVHNWSLLYKAHCLQDMERWELAAQAYNKVDPAFFVKYRAWRYEHLLEQRAYCWFKHGYIKKALQEFDDLLARWENNPHLAKKMWGLHLIEVITESTYPDLFLRVNKLLHRENISN